MLQRANFGLLEYTGMTRLLSILNKEQISRLLDVLVVDLIKQPYACEEELEALPESLTAVAEEMNATTWAAFSPILAMERTESSTTCSIHSKIGPRILRNIDRYLHRESHYPPYAMTSTYHVRVFFLMQNVFDEEKGGYPRANWINVETFSECAGCRIRRIVSDKLLLGTLMIASHLRPSVFTDLIEMAWHRLGSKIMGLHDVDVVGYIFDQRDEATTLGANARILSKGTNFGELNMMPLIAIELCASSHMIQNGLQMLWEESL
jgi:hypothetical protein